MQPNNIDLLRLALTRVIAGITIFTILLCEINENTLRLCAALLSPEFDTKFSYAALTALRYIALVFAALFVIDGHRVVKIVLLVSYCSITFTTANMTPGYFNYNTHLVWILLLLIQADCGSTLSLIPRHYLYPSQQNKQTLRALAICLTMVYPLSALAKLSFNGAEWFTTGDGIRFALHTSNSHLASWILAHPNSIPALATSVGLFEFSFPVLIFFRSTRNLAVLGALLFHFCTWLTLGISFWHLWVFFPPIFLIYDGGRN